MSDGMMSEIENLQEDGDLPRKIGHIMNEAMRKLMLTHTPVRRKHEDQSLNVLRAASALGSPHISEVYPPPRVCSVAQKYGMRPGFSLDLTVLDSDGTPWDFSKEDKRKRALKLIRKQKPDLLVGSPMCRAFSSLQGLNRARMGEVKYQAMLEHGREHLKFVAELYEEQAKNGRYYLHEHPAAATSWQDPSMKNLVHNWGGIITGADLCQFGMKSSDMYGTAPAKKPTKFLTNSTDISKWLSRI